MNANCLDGKSNFKLCPYRIFTEEHKGMVVGSHDCTTQEFYPCAGDKCIAYHVGICLRLNQALREV